MSALKVHILGRDYQIACDDGQEAHLGKLAQQINERARKLVDHMGSKAPESMMLVLTALMLADELHDAKSDVSGLRKQIKRIAEEGGVPGDLFDATKLAEMEAAMASTLDDIAARIEKICTNIDAA